MATGLIGPAVSTHIPGPGPHSALDLGLLARGPGLSQPKHLPGCAWDATTRQGTGAFLTVIKLAKPKGILVVRGFQTAFFLDGTADSAPDPSGHRQEDSVPS